MESMNSRQLPTLVICLFATLAIVGTIPASAQTEEARRDQLWSLFADNKPKITNCYKMVRCEELSDTFLHRRNVGFIDPLLRVTNLADTRVVKLLGDCKPTELDHFEIADGTKRSHTDVGAGPIVIYSLPDTRGRQRNTALRFEYWKLTKRADKGYKGVSILQLQPCRILSNAAFNDDVSLDTGFFTFGDRTYHYDIWKYANGESSHYALGIDQTAIDQPTKGIDGGSLYVELQAKEAPINKQ